MISNSQKFEHIRIMFYYNSDEYNFNVLSKVKHNGCFPIKLFKKSLKFSTKDLLDAPKIYFKTLDDILQRRIYQISYPMTRKYFWTISKSTTDLGEKPKTYICHEFDIYLQLRENMPNSLFFVNGNAVVNVQGSFRTYADKMPLLLPRFFDLNHIYMTQYDGDQRIHYLSQVTLSTFFHDGVEEALLSCQFEIIFKMMPNLKRLDYYAKAPVGWEKMLPKNHQMIECNLHLTKIQNFESIYKFISNQRDNFVMTVREDYCFKGARWFATAEKQTKDKRCLVFGSNKFCPRTHPRKPRFYEKSFYFKTIYVLQILKETIYLLIIGVIYFVCFKF